jgi:hypothetical protein
MLLGVGIGFGWHYFVDSAGVTAVASVATPAAQHDAPDPPSANPPSRGEGAGLNIPRSPVSSDAQQTTTSSALDLSGEERLTLGAFLTRAITNDRYPSSLRVRTLRDILTKLDAKSPVQPDPAPKPRRARGYSVGES